MKIRSLRGMKDILPPEVYVWQSIEEKTREFLENHGYKEIRTPLLEEISLFRQSIGEGTDIVNKEMYDFTDKGGRHVALRPEGTAPIVRAYIENAMGESDFLKLYYIGPMFRSERPQKGRSRQFHQIGVEAIGHSGAYIDAGLIFMMAGLLKNIGLSAFKIKLCSLGCAKDKQKFAKELREFLLPEQNRLCDNCKIRLEKNVLRTLDCKVESCKSLLRNSPKAKDFLCPDCAAHYSKVKELLTTHTPVDFKEDAGMVRGLDYYTGIVFVVTHSGTGAQDAIAAGGRYDNLVEDFGGKKTEAIGFAIGMERLVMALSPEKKMKLEKNRELEVYTATTGSNVCDEAYKTMEPFRDSLFCEINYDPKKSLKSQLRQANKKNARLVVIFGDEELKRGEIVLRNMKTSEQRNIKTSELRKELSTELKKEF
ncbi:MAG: histidine--tRNA ligase [Candidatus Omnitrophota bacterium]|nr:histidine--tRNA ligase [Candidatus Omnitrophota bacterium]